MKDTYNEYTCVNKEKLNRVIYGTPGKEGKLEGGLLGEGIQLEDLKDDVVLARYDQLGGLILNKEGRKVETGSFWNFQRRETIAKPEPILVLTNLEGTTVRIKEGADVPLEVKVAESMKKRKTKKKSERSDETWE